MTGGLTEAGTPRSIHTVPGWVSGKTQQPFSLSAQELKALSEGILTGIEHWIALALNGVTIFGVHPFEVLQAIGEKIREAESSSHVVILIQSGVDLLTTAVKWFLNKIGLNFPKLAKFLGGISVILAKFDPLSGEFDPVGAIRSLIQHIRTSAEDDFELAADLAQMIATAVGDDVRTVLGWARSTWTALGRLFGDPEGRLDAVIDSLGNFNLKQALINFFKNVLADIDAAEDLLTALKNLVSRGGLQDILDKVGGKIGAGLADAENRLQYLLKDGTGRFQGLANILDDDANQLNSWLANLDHTGVWTDLTQLRDSLGNPLQGGWLANLDHTGGWTDLTKLKDTLGNPLQGGWLTNLDHTGFYDASQGFANRTTSLLRYLDPSTGKWLDASKIVANVGGAVTDIETSAQNILDKVGGKLSAELSDAEDRLRNLTKDGNGLFQGVGILHAFGLDGDAAHGLLWDAFCNGAGLPGIGHGYADVQSAQAGISRQIDELINGKKAVLTIIAEAGSGSYDPSVVAPWMVDGDNLYAVALGGGGGGAGGAGVIPGVGGNAGSWSSTGVTALVRGTDWSSGDTFDYVVGAAGDGGPTPGGSSNPGDDSTITLHGGSVIATGTGGSSVTGTSAATDAWWGAGVSPNTNTVDGTAIVGGTIQKAAGYGGHSSGGAGAGGRRNGFGSPGGGISPGGDGASGLVAFLAVQA